MNPSATLQYLREEVANSLTHGFGLVLSAAGLAVLVVLASLKGDAWHITSVSIYGGTLVFLYTASTLYHSARSERVKHFLRLLDHIAIFFLIAGTYTPFTLVLMRNEWGWALFGLAWGLALLGIVFKLFSSNRFRKLSLLTYLGMGWMAVLFLKPILSAVPAGAFLWMVLGGLSYTLGTVFYAWEKLPYNHAIWHLFVLAGSIFHYFAILFYVLP